MNRIAIIGTSCSGKSTLAARISNRLSIPHIELDQLHWSPNWVERTDTEFLSLVASEIEKADWVTDGNYAVARKLIWPNANTILWLDFSFPRVIFRAVWRSVHRAVTKEEVCSGNTESFRQSFFSRDSVILWVIKTHRANRLKYKELLSADQYKGCHVEVFSSPKQLNIYLARLPGVK